MKILKLILILFISIKPFVLASQNIECDKLLDKEIKLKENNISKLDIKSLKECGHHFEKFETIQISLAIGDIISKGEKLTYRSLFFRLEEVHIKLKSQMKNQIILLIFKLLGIVLILLTILYWLYQIYKHKKPQSRTK